MASGIKILLILWIPITGICQKSHPDSLKQLLMHVNSDSDRYFIHANLFNYYVDRQKDSALTSIDQCLMLAQRNNKKLTEAITLNGKGIVLRHMGKYPESLQCYLDAFEIVRDPDNEKSFWRNTPWISVWNSPLGTARQKVMGYLHMGMANLFIRIGNNEQSTYHFTEASKIGEQVRDYVFLYYLYTTMGIAYKNMKRLDSALILEQRALSLANQFDYRENLSRVLAYIGDIHVAMGDFAAARHVWAEGIQSGIRENNPISLVIIYYGLTKMFISEKEKDSSLYYAKKAKEGLDTLGSFAGTEWNPATANENLFLVYKLRGETDSAYKYMNLALRSKDSLSNYGIKSSAGFQGLFLREQIRLKEMEKEKIQVANRVRTWSMLAGITVLLLLAIIIYRNNRQKQKAKIKIEKAYNELKSTQAQLIQQEKMASLGELTAGIAHEIQNPLNFVNNFSEVNKELLLEMKDEIEKGNMDEVKSIANDVIDNQEKINHHGKRADAIVKGMLQHSRSSSGVKEPTNINALADEYL
ncbi:MAG TPA: hypothetical protein VI461_00670, partial [Chitinophagaceae bacterium]|nr:hypothetical protein [Chitinophagaceae bacterium]